ncbi:ubiquinol-cytochrome c reductase cytochrome b subunit, partial [Streptodolium elevatio]
LVQINPIWSYGPYNPGQITAGSQPDWYIGFLEGSLRIMPNWETNLWGHTISWNVLIPSLVVPGVMFTFIAAYPWLEAWVTGDKREHHLLDRPRNVPVRTGLGAAWIAMYLVLWIGGGNDIIATHFHLSINAITWTMRVLFFVAPVLAFVVARRIAMALQRRDRDKVLHGRETGIIKKLPHGEFIEVHEPLDAEKRFFLTAHEQPAAAELPPAVDENGVARKLKPGEKLRVRLSRWYFAEPIEKPTAAEYEEITSGHGHH